MITNNGDDVAKSLQNYTEVLEKKLQHMIAGFAGDVAVQAALSTPVASDQYVQSHQVLYKQRLDAFGIPMSAGFHQGSWQYAEGELVLDPAIKSVDMVQNQTEGEALASYKLGDTFYIGSIAPNIAYLANRDGIQGKVTEAGVLAAYASDIKLHFDRG